MTKNNLPEIAKIILVSSCKGGVGKSTISAALAGYLLEQNKKVGLLDSDIYGPSIPEIVGLENFTPEVVDNKIIPPVIYGIKIMSIALLTLNSGAFIWRGPMLTKAVAQLFSAVDWGALDYLIVDTPPGTGDVHISILNNYQVNGAVIVTIPSNVSANDVARCIDMYRKFNTSIYGIIENMSYYQDISGQIDLFGKGAGDRLSKDFDLPLIAKSRIVQGLSEMGFLQLHKELGIDFKIFL